MNIKNIFALLPLIKKYGSVITFIYGNLDKFKDLLIATLDSLVTLLEAAEGVAKMTPTEADDKFIANLIEEVEQFKAMLGK